MGLSAECCCLACTCGGAGRGHMLSNSGEKFEARNAFVSGDGRSSRWCTVEVSSQRLWCMSVMSVREKCDEKSWEERSGSWQCGIPALRLRSGQALRKVRGEHLTCPPEYGGHRLAPQKPWCSMSFASG